MKTEVITLISLLAISPWVVADNESKQGKISSKKSVSIQKKRNVMTGTSPSNYLDIRSQIIRDVDESEYVNHDDNSGARGGSTTPSKIQNNNTQVSQQLDPIQCTHPAYTSLCNEIKLYAKNAATTVSSATVNSCNRAASRFTGRYFSHGCVSSRHITYKVYDNYYWSNTTQSCQTTQELRQHSSWYCGNVRHGTQR